MLRTQKYIYTHTHSLVDKNCVLLYIFTSAYHQNLILQVKNISKLSVKNVKFVLNEENLKKKINTKQDHIIYRGQRKKIYISHTLIHN